jgi:hypothetical protein
MVSMFWRWLVRGLALTLLTLCAVAYAGSDFQRLAFVWEQSLPRREWIGALGSGWLALEKHDIIDLSLPTPVNPGLRRTLFRDGAVFQRAYSGSTYHGFGFAYHPDPSGLSHDNWYVIIPLWFPTLLSAGLLWLVWRKTRKPNPGVAFPVEIAAPPQPPDASHP